MAFNSPRRYPCRHWWRHLSCSFLLLVICSLTLQVYGQTSGGSPEWTNLDHATSVDTFNNYYDRAKQQICFSARITNTSGETLQTPMVLTCSNLPQGVTLVADGLLPDGAEYVDFTNASSAESVGHFGFW